MSFFCALSANRPPVSKTVQRRPSKVYQWLGPRSRTRNSLVHFVHPPPKVRNLASICEHFVTFEAFWFRNRSTYRIYKTWFGTVDDCSKYCLGNFAYTPYVRDVKSAKVQNVASDALWFRNEATYIRISETNVLKEYFCKNLNFSTAKTFFMLLLSWSRATIYFLTGVRWRLKSFFLISHATTV